MKTKLLLALAFLVIAKSKAQNNDNIISLGMNVDPSSVFSGDLDGDGDADVLSASKGDNSINWHENNDGYGNFLSPETINSNAADASSVYAADIDGDGDLDVLSASEGDDKIAWYDNTDSAGTFGVQQSITTNANGANAVYASDLDGDGDMDVLSASSNDDKIAWYENIDGTGTFGTQQTITSNADGASDVFAIDLDGDGDKDVLSSSFNDGKVAWYENTDGQGNFGSEQIINNYAYDANDVHADDLDGDGDMDVLSASTNDNLAIVWYENIDGQGNFGSQIAILFTSGHGYGWMVHTVDMDGDGDMDVVGPGNEGVLRNNKNHLHNYIYNVGWLENFGNGNFGPVQNISNNVGGLTSIYPTDINGDGNMDVVSASTNQDKIAWHENIIIPQSVNESAFEFFTLYPNPTWGILKIESTMPIEKIEVCNNLGQLVLSNADQNQIDLSKLTQGIYFVEIVGKNGKTETKKIIKK